MPAKASAFRSLLLLGLAFAWSGGGCGSSDRPDASIPVPPGMGMPDMGVPDLPPPADQAPPFAPPVDPTVATNIADSTEFLYTGPNPVQVGVAPGTIEKRRVAVLRGQVHTRDGAPLPGVKITILSHPEFGSTVTRADGWFDMAVNGGGLVTVAYDMSNYLPSHRQAQTPWLDFVIIPDVVLLPYDSQVTTIDMAGTGMQVARGSMVKDNDGQRQATLLFPVGTQAQMVLPDGTRQPLGRISVRATEYTVGTNGRSAMPATLPQNSGYTYAVELSADEAMMAGSSLVSFSRPLPFYLENFLNFPVGGAVPAGYYDRQQGMWIASNNGRVIKILGINGGVADLDIDGDDKADDATKLITLGIDDTERARLGTLYVAGSNLWRVPIEHFTPWDYNWPVGPPADATPPSQPQPRATYKPDQGCQQTGSIIECQSQTLGEAISLTGTQYSLSYRSDRTTGRKAVYRLDIPLKLKKVPKAEVCRWE